jgi:ankyrin repeat protein
MSGTAHEMALNAARKDDIDTLRAALEISNEARDAERNDGWTPLHFAAESGHKECVERASADKDAKKKEG